MLGLASIAGVALVGGAAAAAQENATEAAAEPFSFAAEAAGVTVDVVVLDDDGDPVTDLRPEDFEILEDGRPQRIVAFEARDLTSPPPEDGAPVEGSPASGVTNVGAAAETGRVMALLIDDLGIAPPTMRQLKVALTGWIREQALDRDEITITTTSGDRWWSDRAGRGRDDLVATLESLSGKRLDDSDSAGWISEWEAYDIAVQSFNLDKQVPLGQRSRPDFVPGSGFVPGGPRTLEGELALPGGPTATLERVARRYLDARLCEERAEPEKCFARVQAAAQEALGRWQRRAEVAFGAIERLSRSLAGVPGRKSILFVSESFIDDRSIDGPFRDVIDATQRANTAVYFLSAGGLLGSSTFSAANLHRLRGHDVGAVVREETVLSLAGAENLAEATGGAATASNDLAAGLERMARESSAYYLLGYQPDEPPDGKWRDLQVKVARDGVEVRARRSYRASRPEDLARATEASRREEEEKGRKSKRPLAPALLAGSVRAGLPLRMATYIGRPSGDDATVQVVIEVDNSHVHVNRSSTPWRALLDVTVMAARVADAPLVPVDERLSMSLGPEDVGNGWWMISREAALPPGEWQIRAWVRDLGSGESGLLTQRLSVPDVSSTYLSSLVLSDRIRPAKGPDEPPDVVPSAVRRFGGRGDVVCQYEVFNFGGQGLRGFPRLTGGYTLQRAGDSRPRVVAPTPIEKAGARAVRRIVLPLEELEDGRYTIAVSVHDALAQRTIVAREPFVVERPEGERAQEP